MVMSAEHSPDYLASTAFIDSDHPAVRTFAREATSGAATPTERAVALYYAVRDGFRYDPYRIDLRSEGMTASAVLEKGYGFCVTKAVLLAAGLRSLRIPSRLGFADVRNHLATERLLQLMQTDVFSYHGYAEVRLHDRWVKATPAFNATLCERFGVAPLEFDGRSDSIFQSFDGEGNRYMEYLRDHGQFADLPLEQLIVAWRQLYPALMTDSGYQVPGRFEEEASP